MIVLEPVAVTPATLISSTVAETDYPAWAGGTTYAVGDRVIRQHRVRESLVAGNVGNAPETYPDKWLDVGPTNRWAMFDPAAGPRTSLAGEIMVVITPVVPVSAIGFVDAAGSSVRVQITAGSETYFDQMGSGDGTTTFLGLPTPAGQQITARVYGAAGLAALGKLLIGTAHDLGVTESGPTVGITDYSRREQDDFGVTTIVERAWAKRIGARTRLDTSAFNGVQKAMERLLSKPALWIVSPDVQALAAYGFIKDFGSNYTLRDTCFAGLTIEGLPGADRTDSGADPAVDGQSDLQVVPPVTVTDAILTSSTIAELDHPAWAGGTTYGVGAQVTVAADRRNYESLVAGNTGNTPSTSPDKWLDVGPTSRWAMFDEALGTASSATAAISVTLTPPAPVDVVAVLDVVGASVRLRVEDGVGAAVYDQTLPASAQKVWKGLPKPTGQKIIVTIQPQAGVAQVGTLLVGSPLGLGRTEDAPQASLTDYSRKDTDDFGNTTVVPRGTAKRLNVRSMIATSGADDVLTRMAVRRAKPSLWLATDAAEALAIYGFYRDFSLTITENTSVGAFTIEGLTKAAPSPPPVPTPAEGRNGYSIYLTNDGEQLPATHAGEVISYDAATTGVRVDYGGENVTAQFVPVALAPGDGRNPQNLTIAGTYPDFHVTDGFDAGEENASFLFRVAGTGAHTGVVLDKVFSLSKSKAPLDGSPPPLISLSTTTNTIRYDSAGMLADGAVAFTAARQNTAATTLWQLFERDGTPIAAWGPAEAAAFVGSHGYFASSGSDTLTFTPAGVAAFLGNAFDFERKAVVVRAFPTGLPAVYDQEAFAKVKDGTNGTNGLPGAPGADGQTWYPYFAYANSPDGTVDFTTGAPEARAYVGTATGTSPTEPELPGLYAWSEYKGPPFGVAVSGTCVAAGPQIIKSGGAPGWNSQAYSTVGYRDGAAASFRGLGNLNVMAGLNTDPNANASFDTLDHAWYLRADGYAVIFENGSEVAGVSIGPGYGTGRFDVTYDGRFVCYLYNGTLQRTVDVGSGKLFYFDSSFHDIGARLTDVSFTAAGRRGDDGADGIVGAVNTQIWNVGATSSGVTKPGQVPQYAALSVKRGATDITATCSVTLSTSDTTNITATYSSGSITLTKADVEGFVSLAVLDPSGAPVAGSPFRIQVARQLDNPPSNSATAATEILTTLPTNTSFDGPHEGKTVILKANGSGQLIFNMYADLSVDADSLVRSYSVAVAPVWRPAATGGAWSYGSQSFGQGASNTGGTEPTNTPGYASASNVTISGLTAGALYEVGCAARRSGGTGTAYFSGSFQVRQ